MKKWVLIVFVFCAACTPSDSKLQRDVKSSLDLIDTTINVTVVEGVVTLKGQVMDESTKNAAESSVKDVKGVKDVVNELSITP